MTTNVESEKKLRAYSVQGDEHGCIVFATSHVEARRIGANELDGDFGDMESCKLAPEFDEYAPGPVPIKAMIEAGWWYECASCSKHVSQDDEDWEDDEETIPAVPVFVGDQTVYCSQSCHDSEVARRAKERADKDSIIADATALWPGIEVIWTSVYSEPHIIDFRFPEGKYGVRWERDAETVNVNQCDVEVWKAYSRKVKMDRAGITEEDIAETMPPRQGYEGVR